MSYLKPWLTFRTLRTAALPFFWIPATVIFVNDNVAEITDITGSSMAPTLSPEDHTTGRKDRVWWDKWNASFKVQRDDVILFAIPSASDKQGAKRVIATEGDTVVLDRRRRPKREASGADVPESLGWDMWKGRAVVPEGHVWVEGDNWRESRDSNWYGPISKSLILGKAKAVVLPVERFGMKPWEQYKSRTKVIPGEIPKKDDYEALQAM